jgi:acetylornithine/succinyldiaminopimelate/putrescine aminotransferase
MGRTGRAFAYQKFATKPDIVTVAKPLGGGLPLGAIVASDEFAAALSPGLHGSTFAAGPLISATSLEVMNVIESGKLMKNAVTRGAEIVAGLMKLQKKYDFVEEIRGEGLMLGLDLSVEGAPYVEASLNRGLIINCTHEHILRFLPPLIVTSKHVKEFLSKLETVFAETPRPKSIDATASTTAPPAHASKSSEAVAEVAVGAR